MMKSFKSFLTEEVNPTASVQSGKIGVDDPAVRDAINTMLAGVTGKCFVTPYIAFERVSKVLAQFHIHLPRTTFLENDSGMVVFPISQFGLKMGMRDDGEVVTSLHEAVSIKTISRKYYRNEDKNFHTENAILLAKHFGTPEELEAAKAAKKARDKEGGYSGDSPHLKATYEIHKKYSDKLLPDDESLWGKTKKSEMYEETESLSEGYHVYFEYRTNDRGLYDVFCEIVDDTELSDIMDDVHDEMDEYSDADDDPGPEISSAADAREDKFDDDKKKLYEASKDDSMKNMAAGLAAMTIGATGLAGTLAPQIGDKLMPAPISKWEATHNALKTKEPEKAAKLRILIDKYKENKSPNVRMSLERDFSKYFPKKEALKEAEDSAGLQPKPGFKPNPAYAIKQSSTSNPLNNPSFDRKSLTINPVNKIDPNQKPSGPLTTNPVMRTDPTAPKADPKKFEKLLEEALAAARKVLENKG